MSIRAHRLRLAMLLMALMLVSCDGRRYDQAIAVLIDTSGSYVDERPEVTRILKREVIPVMVPGDTLMVIRIDSASYNKSNLETLVTLDTRPSRANAQKLALAQKLDAFTADPRWSQYTDILGAMMLASDYLGEIPAASRVMLVFSDLEQELSAGTHRKVREHEFDGIQVVAMNVKRLRADNVDPAYFRDRLARWQDSVTAGGAVSWRAIMDAHQLPAHLASLR
jgi:hypothetical protein